MCVCVCAPGANLECLRRLPGGESSSALVRKKAPAEEHNKTSAIARCKAMYGDD